MRYASRVFVCASPPVTPKGNNVFAAQKQFINYHNGNRLKNTPLTRAEDSSRGICLKKCSKMPKVEKC
jgi:hypothetical protein